MPIHFEPHFDHPGILANPSVGAGFGVLDHEPKPPSDHKWPLATNIGGLINADEMKLAAKKGLYHVMYSGGLPVSKKRKNGPSQSVVAHGPPFNIDFGVAEKAALAQASVLGGLTVKDLKDAATGKKLGPATKSQATVCNIPKVGALSDKVTEGPKLHENGTWSLKVTPEGNLGDGINLDVEYDIMHHEFIIRLFVWDVCWQTSVAAGELHNSKAQSTVIEYHLTKLCKKALAQFESLLTTKLEHMTKMVKNALP